MLITKRVSSSELSILSPSFGIKFETVFLFYFVCLFFAVGYYKTGWSAIE